MNNKKLACIIIIMLIASVVYGTQMMTKRTKSRVDEAEAASVEKISTESAANVANITYLRLKNDTQDLRQFLDTWTPVIEKMQSSQDAEQTVLGALRNSGILTVSQKFEMKAGNGDNKFMPKIFQGTMIVQDEYTKTMNWLGELETKIPLMRVSNCRLKQGETGHQVNLEVRIDIPLINLNAEVEDKK